MPRPRMTVRRWMFLVAAAAILLEVAQRAYPTWALSIKDGSIATTVVMWSDGSRSSYSTSTTNPSPIPVALRRTRLANALDWSDGSVSWYFKAFWAWAQSNA
ncbi:hypothetical protein [Singulisphaera sp. PoT]|uniref:hypothetical protein n=1 Tax=Singulisphaera sp. PoT TaxID=3411797 RepID=UPI003BF4E454